MKLSVVRLLTRCVFHISYGSMGPNGVNQSSLFMYISCAHQLACLGCVNWFTD